MSDTPEAPPPNGEPAPLAIPPVVANIWQKFATRELAKGRRDVGHLVEVTLQFVMDQNTKNLAPMVHTLEQLGKWLNCIDKELASMQKALTDNPQATMATEYQRQSIVLDKNAKGGPAVVVGPTGQPTRARAELQSYVSTMQKQRELVNQAIGEQTNALQARREHLAQTLRGYSSELQRSASEMLANAPPLPEPAPKKTRKKDTDMKLAMAMMSPPKPQPTLAGTLLRFKLWLTNFNPATMLRQWREALLTGYRADPFELPEQSAELLPPAQDLNKGPKKPKIFTI